MKLLSLTYRINPEKDGGFSVHCLDWKSVFTQGETIAECRKNAIEATELMLEVLNDGKLDNTALPKIKSHSANPFHFQLTFDVEKSKHINLSKIQKKTKLNSLQNFMAIF